MTKRPELDFPHFLQHRMNVDGESARELVPQLLQSLRRHLGLQLAFVTRITEGRRVFQYVDAERGYEKVEAGDSDPVEDSYCQRVVDGRLPELLPDVRTEPEAMRLPVTKELSIASHVGVPIRLSDGSVYGTFCCIGVQADPTLSARDVELLRVFADVTARLVEHERELHQAQDEIRSRTEGVLEQDGISMVYQPIRHLGRHRTVGFEALARFPSFPQTGPDVWFNEAASVGLAPRLEMRAIALALRALELLPPEIYVSCNVSPEVAMHEEFQQSLTQAPLQRLVLEITEHANVKDYERLALALAPLRERGMRLAVDDAGAGYASFRHILLLRPDLIKLDISLTRDIDSHPGRRALAAALIRFAEETGSQLVAEGVETEAELEMLRALQVDHVQGYLVGRPLALEAARAALKTAGPL